MSNAFESFQREIFINPVGIISGCENRGKFLSVEIDNFNLKYYYREKLNGAR